MADTDKNRACESVAIINSSVESPPTRAMYASAAGRLLKVPGCGLPVDYELEQDNSYCHGAKDIEFDRMTVREVSMLGLMEALTDKPAWWRKVFDENIVAKWRREALTMPWITERTWEWCLRELQDKAKEYEATKLTTVLDMGSRCVKTDELVSTDLQNALKSAVQPLLNQTPRDWHPGSNERVLNLVHPSLYPVVYGKTRVLRHKQISVDESLAAHDNYNLLVLPGSDSSNEIETPGHSTTAFFHTWNRSERDTDDRIWSTKLQWLPCDVSFINDTDNSVAIESYINNLHPEKYRPLYRVIESLISLSIPAWNQVLVYGNQGRTPHRIKTKLSVATDPPEEPEWSQKIDDSTEEGFQAGLAQINEYFELPDNPENETWFYDLDEDWQEYLGIGVEWKFRRIRKVIHPEPGKSPGSSYNDWKAGIIKEHGPGYLQTHDFTYKDVNLRDTFAATGLQVIVKLASIELNPDDPSYPGGSWHLEGMLNEHIVATSIYYYDVENITDSRIRFRQEANLDSTDSSYPQNDHAPLCQIFGVDSLRDEPAIQEIGSIATPNGRFLAFPNTLQHRVEPFSLADPTEPGHRRFLVLWLVDPHYRVLSTGNVPPQQHEWWKEKAREAVNGRVSNELQAMIEDQLRDGTMTRKEAKAYRRELMAERSTFVDVVRNHVREYNFCEH